MLSAGDNAPAAVVEGCIDALKKYPDMSVTLCGDGEKTNKGGA